MTSGDFCWIPGDTEAMAKPHWVTGASPSDSSVISLTY